MIFFDIGVIDVINILLFTKVPAFVSNTSLLMFYLSFQTIRIGNTNFICGEKLFIDLITFFYIIQHIFPFCRIVGSSMHNKGIRHVLASSSISSKMVSLTPPGKFFILTRLFFDGPFSFIPFNNESPVIITLGFLVDLLFSLAVSFIVSLA